MKLLVLTSMDRVRVWRVGKGSCAKVRAMKVSGVSVVRWHVTVDRTTCAVLPPETVSAFRVGWVTPVKSLAPLIALVQTV